MVLKQLVVLFIFLSTCDTQAMFSALSKQFKTAFSKKALPASHLFDTKVTIPSKMQSLHTLNKQKAPTTMQEQKLYKSFSGHIDRECKKKFIVTEQRVKHFSENLKTSDSQIYKKLKTFKNMQALVDYICDQEKAAFERLINEIEKRSGLLYTQAQKDFAQKFATDLDCNVLCNAIKHGNDIADETVLYQLFLNVNGIDCNSIYQGITAYIKTLMAKMNLDPDDITLFYSNNHYGSVAAMCDLFKYIRFDPSSVQSFPNEQWPELAWIAVHELAHFYNRDSLKLQVVKLMCKKIKRSNPTIEKSLVEWQSWNEHKADIFFLDKRFEQFGQTEKLKLLKQAKRTLIHLVQLAGTNQQGQIDWDELQNDRDKTHPHPLKRFAYLDHAEALLKSEIQQKKTTRTASFFLKSNEVPVESNGLLGKQEL